jgi:hypothetical protein
MCVLLVVLVHTYSFVSPAVPPARFLLASLSRGAFAV